MPKKDGKLLWPQRTAEPSQMKGRPQRKDLSDASLGRISSFPEGSGNLKSRSTGSRGVGKMPLMIVLHPSAARTRAKL
jgi:hypothetical protein